MELQKSNGYLSMNRCFGTGKEFYEQYHDQEWGIPVHDDTLLFEMLILEGAQAGLSWETILKRREDYRKAYHNFDPVKVSMMTDDELQELYLHSNIIRNRLKIYAARQNAKVYLEIQKEFGSFDRYVWKFVNQRPIQGRWTHMKEIPVSTAESMALSKDLKKQGMTFVGPTIIYAFMQAVGLVNDHLIHCSSFKPGAHQH